MPDVEEIKTPVRENDAGAPRPRDGELFVEVFQGPELLAHPEPRSQGVGMISGLRDAEDLDPLVQRPAPGGVV